MKFIHLSDLHLGKRLNEFSLLEDQEHILKQITEIIREEHPDGVLAVCGCHSQHDPEAIRALGVDLIGGSAQREDFIRQLLATCLEKQAGKQPVSTGCPDNALKRRSFEILPPGGLEGRTRAMLKVQDGCVNFCT